MTNTEGKPYINNEESKEVSGAYINCWVKANDETTAKDDAIKYINSQEWELLNKNYNDLADEIDRLRELIMSTMLLL